MPPATTAPPEDYEPKSGTLSIPAGSVSGTIAVTVRPDLVDEMEREALPVSLTGVSGATVLDGVGVVTFLDDDPSGPVALAIGDVTVDEGDGGTRTARLIVSLSGLDLRRLRSRHG